VLAGFPVWVPIRVALRIVAALTWTFGAFFLSLLASVAGLLSKPLAKRWKSAISYRWVRSMPPLLGMRVTVLGHRPETPYFLVNNHITWFDFIAMSGLCRARAIVMAEMLTTPVLGTLVGGLGAIPTRRLAEDTPACLAEMMAALRRGENLMMAPEGNISPGREVRRFRPRLFEAAVRSKFPVHYASITYRTPRGCPPAAERVLFGPDPHFPWPDGKIPESEFEGWGTQRNFLSHLVRALALPHFEIEVRFGTKPILGTSPVQLANELHQAVTRIFTPVQGQRPAAAAAEK
jgi:1-acyl-sn-glycerol-3-phosphate acyltransferase